MAPIDSAFAEKGGDEDRPVAELLHAARVGKLGVDDLGEVIHVDRPPVAHGSADDREAADHELTPGERQGSV